MPSHVSWTQCKGMSMSEVPQTPPPPPGSGGSSSSGGMNADQMKAAVQSAHPYDLGIIAAGVLAFLFSLFSYYSVSAVGVSRTYSAWHGFFGWFAALVALAVAVLLALHLMGIRPLDAAMTRLVALAGFGLATLCTLLALFVVPSGPYDCQGVSACEDAVNRGHGFSYWISLLLILAGLALSFLRKDATD